MPKRSARAGILTHDINRVETFVPAAGEAAGPPIAPAIIIRLACTRDDRPSNRSRDIKRVKHFYPPPASPTVIQAARCSP